MIVGEKTGQAKEETVNHPNLCSKLFRQLNMSFQPLTPLQSAVNVYFENVYFPIHLLNNDHCAKMIISYGSNEEKLSANVTKS